MIDRAREEGIEFALPAINPKTLRHSFTMHLFFNHVPPKVVQAYMGHEHYESTEVYLKVLRWTWRHSWVSHSRWLTVITAIF
ncbi:TPA: tyrosine-type recombinase/integrase [Salmonella enterica subsp. enterica serovar Muenchen]